MTTLLFRLLIVVAIFVSAGLLTSSLLGMVVSRQVNQRAVNKRLRLLKSGADRDELPHLFRKDRLRILGENASVVERRVAQFERTLMMAGVPASAQWLIWASFAGFGGIFVLLLMMAWSAAIPLNFALFVTFLSVAGAVAIGLPLMVINYLAERRRKLMEKQFPASLDIFTRALRAGHPVAGAINLVTDEMPDPIGSEFGLVSDEVAYGSDLTDSLLAMAERWDMEDMRMFVISLSVQNETGGNLAEILANLSHVIRERETMFMKVRALSSEGRMSAWMLTALPLLTITLVFLANPKFYLDVTNDSIFIYGFPSLVLLYFIGIFMIRKMIDLRV